MIFRRKLVTLGDQRIARQKSDILTENDVIGRLAAAKVIIIHTRHIVVNERGSVYAFNGAGKRERRLDSTAEHTAEFEDQKG